MREELGLVEDDRCPLNTAFSTFVGFNVIGLIPLLPFVVLYAFDLGINSEAFWYSVIFTAIAFFFGWNDKRKNCSKIFNPFWIRNFDNWWNGSICCIFCWILIKFASFSIIKANNNNSKMELLYASKDLQWR